MDLKFCWRCRCEVPMFNDEEYNFMIKIDKSPIRKKLFEEFLKLNEIRNHVELQNLDRFQQRFKYMIEMHRIIGGRLEQNPNAIYHHQLSKYGSDCPKCGMLLRTKKARYCVSCGYGKEELIDSEILPIMERRSNEFQFNTKPSSFKFPF